MSDLVGTKGGSGVWQRIISEMPEHDVYIEPFWGRGTLAKKKKPAKMTIGCDLDDAAISDGRSQNVMMFKCDAIEWLAGYFGAAHDAAASDAGSDDASRNGSQSQISTSPADVATFCGATWLRHLVYLDPPYLGCEHYYNHYARHQDIMWLFKTLPCPVMLSGYHSKYYDAELSDARVIEIPTVNRAGQRVIECLWMNFNPPARYHDTRFVGKDRRERERIKRRCHNWAAQILKLDGQERQAIMDAVNSADDQ